MHRKLHLISLVLLLVLFGQNYAEAKTYGVKDVPNVHLSDATQYVSDPDNLLRPETLRSVNATLKQLEDSTTVQTAFVVVNDIGNADIYDFALGIGREWGVGHKDNNNGIVVIFALNQRQVRIQTGSGVEGVLPDISAKRLIDEKVIPNMKRGDLDNAVKDLSSALYTVFTDPKAAAELRSKDEETEDLGAIFLFYCSFVGAISLFLLFYYIAKMSRMDSYRKALACRENRWVFVVLAVVSAGFGLPALLVYLAMGYFYRNRRRNCDVCGTRMRKLSEEEDNEYLNPYQDKEEQLKSVDYDVWLCPKCETTEIFPFVNNVSKYKVCPQCHSRTLGLLYDRVERKPTHITDGAGVKVYQCKNCQHKKEEHYKIPKHQTAVFIGTGGFGGGRGGGGGISGGSWGGGGFSGGGASGRW